MGEIISESEVRCAHAFVQTLSQMGVPIVEHAHLQQMLNMAEADKVDRYNDMRALQLLLMDDEELGTEASALSKEQILEFLAQKK